MKARKPIFRRRSSMLKVLKRIWSDAHRCFVKMASLFVGLRFNGIDKIAGGFTSKVDDRKSSKIQFISSMLQKAPKRRSPNPYNYKLKWTETVIVPEVRLSFGSQIERFPQSATFQNMQYFPSASHNSPMATFNPAD